MFPTCIHTFIVEPIFSLFDTLEDLFFFLLVEEMEVSSILEKLSDFISERFEIVFGFRGFLDFLGLIDDLFLIFLEILDFPMSQTEEFLD